MDTDTIGMLVEQASTEEPHREWLFFEDQKYTFDQVNRHTNRVANMLEKSGIRKGEKAAIILSNSPEFIFTWFALAKIGAVMIPINTSTKGEMLSYIINHSDAKVLVIHDEFYPFYLEVKGNIENIEQVIVVEKKEKQIFSGAQSYRTELEKVSDNYHTNREVQKEDLMCILYTSGTTGLPKGVMLSHNTYFKTGQYVADYTFECDEQDRIYTSLPLFHVNAQQATTMPALLSGAPLIIAEKFSASNFWKDMVRYKVTIFKFIGAILSILHKQPPSEYERAHNLRLGTGAPVPMEIWESFEKRFNVQLLEGYGLTETATVCLTNTLTDFRIGSCGKPYPHFDVSIVNEDDKKLPANEVGEIVVRGLEDNVLMEGYYKMPDKTKEVMQNGWFHTGDRGYYDDDGYFYFVDRMKDSIRRRGENISSFMIEKVILEHSKVLECAAVGVPDELSEEEVKIYIKLKPNETLEPEELISWCKENMASFMIPRYVEFVDEFPKTPTERIKKYKLKEAGIGKAWDRVTAGIKFSTQ